MTPKIRIEDWHGLYGERWQGEIHPDAIEHPAKFARGLIKKIYQVAIEEGWLQPGDTVIDPFGGVALGSLDAMVSGMTWVGVELEQRFVDLGTKNIDRWREMYRNWPDLGQAKIVQGDSRYLSSVLGEVDGSISSPPFLHTTGGCGASGGTIDEALIKRHSASNKNNSGYGETPGQLHNLDATDDGFDLAVSSPPYANSEIAADLKRGPDVEERKKKRAEGAWEGYGDSEGQLGRMKDTGYDVAISSPPFVDKVPYQDKSFRLNDGRKALPQGQDGYGDTEGQLGQMKDAGYDMAVSSPPYAETRIAGNGDEGASGLRDADGNYVRGSEGWKLRKELGARYGETEGNLGNQKDAGFDAAVTSPPFEGSNPDGGYQLLGKYAKEGKLTVGQVKGDPNKLYPSWDPDRQTPYAPSPENIGNEEGEEFWTSARKIIDQVYMVLKPGACAIWVTKRFVKNGEIVDFSDMWYRVCIAAGFEPVVWYRAWVVEELGIQYDLMGNPVQQTKSRKSFFRRLAEKKGSPAIDYEDVVVVRKPERSS